MHRVLHGRSKKVRKKHQNTVYWVDIKLAQKKGLKFYQTRSNSPDENLLSSQSLSVGHVRTGRPVSDEFGSPISNVRENPRRDSENVQIKILLERQQEQHLADYRAEIQKHEFQADFDKRSVQKLNGVIESQRGEIYRAHQGDEQLRRDQQLLHERLLEQNRELREAHVKSLNQ